MHFLEKIKWIAVFLLFCLAAGANQLYPQITHIWRFFAVVFFSLVAIFISLLTNKGKLAISFIQEAKAEVRKVIWPTYQDTFHTTIVVSLVIFASSLIIWGLDSILVFLISSITLLRF